jgi:hypothetical protein
MMIATLPQSSFQKIARKAIMVRKTIVFITLRMVFVLACTICDVGCVSCQSLHQAYLFVACLVVSLHHHSWALLSNVVPLKKQQ